MSYLLRMANAVAVAVVACAAITATLLVLPRQFALGTMFAGLILFLVGAKLGYRSPAAVGGVLMFGGVFAAALLGIFG